MLVRDRISSELAGKTAVVTGGANGIGRSIVEALLDDGARVVIADIEAPVLDATVAELADRGDVTGVRTDVSDPESFEALADAVFATHGACHLLFNNAGVTSGGGGKPWEQEHNDFRWCFGVNVFGTANGCAAFVPRMIESGEPGRIVNTSSGDGGFAPVPRASVYAASKAAVSCFTEALAHNLISDGTALRASVFYPSGGLIDTRPLHRQPQPARRARPHRRGRRSTVDDLRRAQGRAREGRHARCRSPTCPHSVASRSTAPSGATTSSPATSTRRPTCCTAGPTRSVGASCHRTTGWTSEEFGSSD